MGRNFILVLIVLAVLMVITDTANVRPFFIVKETERALLLRFGEVVRADIGKGLHFKIPIANNVRKFDSRILTLDSAPERYFTIGKKPLDVDSFAKWRVIDVEGYYTATGGGDEAIARGILLNRINEGLRNEIGKRDMHEVISGERDELMQVLTKSLDAIVREDDGVEIIDIRVKKIELPAEVSSTVYQRMNSEREIEAKQYRATGNEQSLIIQADADRQVVVIEANAYRDSETIRGDGDATSARIYADAFGQDPEFYEFYRSINAYTEVFQGKNDMLIIDPSSDFFKYLKSNEG